MYLQTIVDRDKLSQTIIKAFWYCKFYCLVWMYNIKIIHLNKFKKNSGWMYVGYK